MRKLIAAILILTLCTVAFAVDIVITLTVPEAYGPRVLEMMRQWDHCHISIRVRGSENASDPNTPDYSAEWDITNALPPEDPNTENPKEFGKRFIRQFMLECIKAHEMVAAKADTKALHDAISPADVNVPDEIIE